MSNLAKLIQTDSGRLFVYDGLTSKIISVECGKFLRQENFEVIETEIISDLLRKGFLYETERKTLNLSTLFEKYKSTFLDEVSSIILQTTRNCNLACTYCVYSGNYSNFRSMASENMSLDTMKKSIDFYAIHSKNTPKADISFYGGESLLCFKTILNAIAYANKIFKDKPLKISLSTNGLLLNSQIFSWLYRNPNFRINVTLNGPFHDKYRKDHLGKGTLETIMRNLQLLKSNFPEVWENQLSFIANYTSFTEIEEILQFYSKRVEIKNQPLFLTNIRRDMGNEKIRKILDNDADIERSAKKALRQKYYSNPNGILKSLYKLDLEIIDEREIFEIDAPMRISSCLPFANGFFVRTDGKFNLCERTSDSFILGDLENGFNEELINQTLIEVEKLVTQTCKNCWAQRICLLCFQQMVDENGKIRQHIPEQICHDMKENLYELLQIYCELYG